ncbi:hypothetical protein ABI59_08895 [Acidobacteria bacterium Mor1]|nr:hypothetical protein ABI59_08895 [Acidobacteria bacterium Mor1]
MKRALLLLAGLMLLAALALGGFEASDQVPVPPAPDPCSSLFDCGVFVNRLCERKGSELESASYIREQSCVGTCANGKVVGGGCEIFRRPKR